MPVILGLTVAQWAVILPRVIAVAKFVCALIIGYREINGISTFDATIRVLDLIPKPHKMTPEEENLWFDRASQPSN